MTPKLRETLKTAGVLLTLAIGAATGFAVAETVNRLLGM